MLFEARFKTYSHLFRKKKGSSYRLFMKELLIKKHPFTGEGGAKIIEKGLTPNC